MSNEIVVHKGRTNVLIVDLGFDVSADTFTSEIRADPKQTALLIATWEVGFVSDGSDGKVRLRLDDVITAQITANSGFMDMKRVSGGEALPVFDKALEVTFRGSVTV